MTQLLRGFAGVADINSIADPRNHLYVDLYANQRGTAVDVEATNGNESKPSSSDLGEPRLRIDRSSYFRTAIRLDSAGAAASVSSLTIRCHPTQQPVEERACQGVEVKGVAVLDRSYGPLQLNAQKLSPQTIKPGEKIVVRVRS